MLDSALDPHGRARAPDCAEPAGAAWREAVEGAETTDADARPPRETNQWVLFRAGGVLFAVAAESVERAERRRSRHAAPLDLAPEMGRQTREGLSLALRAGASRVWLRADEVLEVTSLPLQAIYALPRLVAARQRGNYVLGLAVRGDELAVLLDVSALADAAGSLAQPRTSDTALARSDDDKSGAPGQAGVSGANGAAGGAVATP